MAIYAIGTLACVYHLANGVWTMGITWGLWTSPKAQRAANIPCVAGGVLLAVVAMAALYGMRAVDVTAPTADGASSHGYASFDTQREGTSDGIELTEEGRI